MAIAMKTALAALPYYWSKDEILEFYAQAAQSTFDVIYVGETVCSKRHELRWQDWLSVARDLRDAGKDVVMSSLTLLESSADWRQLEKLCLGDFTVEANDVGAIQLCSQHGKPFVTGAGINCYNANTVKLFASLGARRVVLPFDLPQASLQSLIEQTRDCGVEFEIQVYGPLALAYSARCFTARHYDLPKDDCQYMCQRHPQGLSLFSREQEKFLTINGIQTQSGEPLNLLDKTAALAAIGVTHRRVVPRDLSSLQLLDNAAAISDSNNGFWHGQAGMKQVG